MASQTDLMDWVAEALRELGGSGRVPDIAKVIWEKHEAELRASGDLFYTWQYAMRWAGQQRKIAGKMRKNDPKSGHWSLTKASA